MNPSWPYKLNIDPGSSVPGEDTIKYVVTIDNPYYNDVDYASTLEEATALHLELIKDRHEADGEYEVAITVSEIKIITHIRTSY